MLNCKTRWQRLFGRHCYSLVYYIVAVFILTACGGDDEATPTVVATPPATPITTPKATPNVTLLDVILNDSYYGTENTNLTNPPIWTVPANTDILVNIENRGRLTHNWAIVKPGITIPVPYEEGQGGDILLHGIGMVYGHNQTMATVSPLPAGEYLIICTVSGHYPLMQGRLIVTDK